MPRDLARPRDHKFGRVYGRKLLIVYTHHTKLFGSRYIMVLFSHVIIWLCDFMGRNHLGKVTILPSFVAIGILVEI